jgi:hypothetical protein
MLTIFTTLKSFQGHAAIIQRNALISWTLLRPACEIILFGNDQGTAEIALELNLRHIPRIACNEYDTPLVSDIFAQARRLATHKLLCYANGDIIFMNDFLRAVKDVASAKDRFLMVGQRWDTDVKELIDFEADWETWLRDYTARQGKLHPKFGLDYFVFSHSFAPEMPPFAIGRPIWDNWLIYHTRCRKIPLIDATQVVMAIHQNHDYTHRKVGQRHVGDGPEAEYNVSLANPLSYGFGMDDATHILTSDGLKRVFTSRHIRQYLKILIGSQAWLRLPLRLLLKLIELSYPIRARLGLTALRVERQ